MLSVTCDACASLSQDLCIVRSTESFLGLLGLREEEVINRPFEDFVAPHDRDQFQSVVSFSSATPGCGFLAMLGPEGHFQAKLLLVKVADPGFLLVLTRESQEPAEMVEGGPDMRDLVGGERGCETVASCNQLDIEELTQISLSVDPMSVDVGFIVHTVTFEFADVAQLERLPNVLEWLERPWQDKVCNWIQAQVNHQVNGLRCDQVLEDVPFLTPGAGYVKGDLHFRGCGDGGLCHLDVRRFRQIRGSPRAMSQMSEIAGAVSWRHRWPVAANLAKHAESFMRS